MVASLKRQLSLILQSFSDNLLRNGVLIFFRELHNFFSSTNSFVIFFLIGFDVRQAKPRFSKQSRLPFPLINQLFQSESRDIKALFFFSESSQHNSALDLF